MQRAVQLLPHLPHHGIVAAGEKQVVQKFSGHMLNHDPAFRFRGHGGGHAFPQFRFQAGQTSGRNQLSVIPEQHIAEVKRRNTHNYVLPGIFHRQLFLFL